MSRSRTGFYLLRLVLIVSALLMTLASMSYADNTELPKESVRKGYDLLLIYDYRNYFADYQDSVTTTAEMMGHFDVNVDEIDQLDYRPGQMATYDYIVVIGMQGEFSNTAFLQDISDAQQPILWVGKGIEKILDLTERYDFEYAGPYYDFTNVTYKNISYPIGVKREFSAMHLLSDRVKVYSWLHTGTAKLPFILNDKNLWYVTRIDLNEPLIMIFADVLFEILPPYVEPYQKVYLRIEDVHPFRDPDKLKEIADYLYSENIPFIVGLIPAHKQPDTTYITEMDEVPGFVEAIQYMQAKGGSIILHGYTHTVYGSDITGEGFEYWNGIEDKPLDLNIDEWIRYTIGRGVRLCVENDIYPLGFEAPHYAMSQDAYRSLKKYFSTYSGQIQSSDWGFSTSIIPYEVRDSDLFIKFLPESLGYVQAYDEGAIDKIKENYSHIKIVRSYLAGVFYHPYLDIEHLKELVEFLKSEHAEFYDMKQDYHWVSFDGYDIINNYGELQVSYPKDRRDTRKRLRKFFNLTTLVLITILSLVLYTFLKLYFASKSVTDKKMKG